MAVTKPIRILLSNLLQRNLKPAPASSNDASALPSFDELPAFHEFAGCAWGLWGENDQLGTVNLLTDDLVQRAAKKEILIGRTVSLNWPLNFPEKVSDHVAPMFGRKSPAVMMTLREGKPIVRDDEIHINTQSGTQWDGLRHFGILEHGVFYDNTPAHTLPHGIVPMPDPQDIDSSLQNIGIQNWADHGICGRGVLLDLVRYHTKAGAVPLAYDPWSTHGISVKELEACAVEQGVVFQPCDILLLRVGFIQKYCEAKPEERDELARKEEAL
ncbi:hypothetical protein DXG03_003740 [Asterophora parasitica]|uniref:Cyclase n=1 Tax=Asterophora parasitica TaxID=117018 RepID=A0A9P7G7S5_9AGAR|nr:hypothetical protein DXG03_003740 [Asterophora parasitica]